MLMKLIVGAVLLLVAAQNVLALDVKAETSRATLCTDNENEKCDYRDATQTNRGNASCSSKCQPASKETIELDAQRQRVTPDRQKQVGRNIINDAMSGNLLSTEEQQYWLSSIPNMTKEHLKSLSHGATDNLETFQYIQANCPDLIELVMKTESMDPPEKKYWIDILPEMKDKQITQLCSMLSEEKNNCTH